MKKKRRILEFSTYGPKAFASTKALDSDLADRCIRVPMTRTLKKLPDLEGWEPAWPMLRDKLYRFTLGRFKDVKAAYQAIPGDGTRIGELWRPILTVLEVLGVEKAEVEAIHELFLGAVEGTRHELTNWEIALFESLKAEAESSPETFEMTPDEILRTMGIEGDVKPGAKWVGDTLSRFNLVKKRLPRRTVAGKKVQPYLFESPWVIKLYQTYMRESPPNGPSGPSTGENGNDTDEFHGREHNSGTCPDASSRATEGDGREGTRPGKEYRPAYHTENTNEFMGGRIGHQDNGGIGEKIFADGFFEDGGEPEATTCGVCAHFSCNSINPTQGFGRCLIEEKSGVPGAFPGKRSCRHFETKYIGGRDGQ